MMRSQEVNGERLSPSPIQMYVKWTVDVGIRSFLRCLGAWVVLRAVQIEEYVVVKRLTALESASKSADCSKSSNSVRGVHT